MEVVFEKRLTPNSLYQLFDEDFAEKEKLRAFPVPIYESSLHYDLSDFSLPDCFVFIDGTVQHITGGRIRSVDFDIAFDVFFMCVAAGYDNGQLIESKVSKYLLLRSNYENDSGINHIFENIKSKAQINLSSDEYIYQIHQVHIGKDILECAMNFLRDEEFEFLRQFCDNLSKNSAGRKYAIVIDGNIRLQKLKGNLEDFIVVGVVKNPLNLYQAEDEIKTLKNSERTNLFKVEDIRSSKSKFSFFLRIGQNEAGPNEFEFVRIDFSGKVFQDIDYAIYFSDFISKKILSFSSSIGERAPQNLVPFRILEKRIRAILGDENIRKRKEQEKIKQILFELIK